MATFCLMFAMLPEQPDRAGHMHPVAQIAASAVSSATSVPEPMPRRHWRS